MQITDLLTDDAVLAELGARIAARRLELHLSQAVLAEQAGVAKRTLERLESGGTTQLVTLIRVLRVLEASAGLDKVLPDPATRPMALLTRKHKPRQRVARKPARPSTESSWQWDPEA